MRLRPLMVLPALLISLGCAAVGRAAVVVESTRSLAEAQARSDASSPAPFAFASSVDSLLSRQYFPSVMGNRTELIEIDGQDHLVGGRLQATAGPILVLSGPLTAAHVTLDAGACHRWTENTAVSTLTPEPGLGPLLIASLALLALGSPRSLRWR